jgi:carboxynorspermidine decarboxylase
MSEQSKITQELLNSLEVSPVWLLEEHLLKKNLEKLKFVKDQTGVKILLALKGFALFHTFDLIREYLDGCCASGLNEAILSSKRFQKQTHTYSPAFKAEEIEKIAQLSNHIVFNSPSQLKLYAKKAREINPDISIGIRVNPEFSSASAEIYNPCGLYSRLGTLRENFSEELLKIVDGFHFHALCEQNSDAFEEVLKVFEEKFGEFLPKLSWVNFGGGHLITKEDYDTQKLIRVLNSFKEKYPNLEIFLEPGEAIGWQTGVLIATVLDIVHNKMDIAILDTSAEAHMPDTVIMPYKAKVRGAKEPFEEKYTYKLTGNTCLAGDVMGDYSFASPLKRGDKIIFEDQMHYTMVKATTFNGINLPSIAILKEDGALSIVREFGYEDFESRLG